MIVITPVLIDIIIYIIIFNHVRSSSHRVQPSIQIRGNNTNNHRQQRMSRRDNHLIRRMIVMFSIFVGGWSPIYIYLIIIPDYFFTSLLSAVFILVAQLCLLIYISIMVN
jgi:hypothetical protein